MGEIDVLKAQVVRQDVGQSWGIHLLGGADFGEPIRISTVVAGSPAARIGLRPEDEVTEVNGQLTFEMTHLQAFDAIERHNGDTLWLTVERKARGPTPFLGETGIGKTGSSQPPKDYQPLDMTGPHVHAFPTKMDSAFGSFVQDTNHSVNVVGASINGNEQKSRSDTFTTTAENYHPGLRSTKGEEHTRIYQPIDLPGPQYYRSGPQKTPFDFHTVQSRPFVEPEGRRRPHTHHPPSPSTSQPIWSDAPVELSPAGFEPTPLSNRSDHSLHFSDSANHVQQSRTFRLLQSVMSNEEPAAGVAGLPPPRSAELERTKREGSSGSNPRVKVLVSQKYNSPMGMYSANNVIETFAAQAESALETIEKQQPSMPEYQPAYSSF